MSFHFSSQHRITTRQLWNRESSFPGVTRVWPVSTRPPFCTATHILSSNRRRHTKYSLSPKWNFFMNGVIVELHVFLFFLLFNQQRENGIKFYTELHLYYAIRDLAAWWQRSGCHSPPVLRYARLQTWCRRWLSIVSWSKSLPLANQENGD